MLSSPEESHPEALPELYVSGLHSYSSHGENRTAMSFPQREQVWLTVDNANQPLPCSTAVTTQLLIFPTSPANQRVADMPLEGPERRRHEASVVVDPSAKFWIDHPSQIVYRLVSASMQFPTTNLIPDFLCRIIRDGRTETTEDLSLPTVRFPGTKRESQKVELLIRVRLLPISILAVDNFRLLRM